MYYKNFDTKITARYGVIIEGWPLEHFVPPSLVKSRTELEVLLRAWETDATRFRKLTNKELERWQEAFVKGSASLDEEEDEEDGPANEDVAGADLGGLQDLIHSAPAHTTSPGPSDPLDTASDDIAPTLRPESSAPKCRAAQTDGDSNKRRRRRADALQDVVNVVASSSGVAIPITKKPRKTRSNKGQPRKKQSTASVRSNGVSEMPPVTATPATSIPSSSLASPAMSSVTS